MITAPGGPYRLLISYRGKRTEFDIYIPVGDETIEKSYTLEL